MTRDDKMRRASKRLLTMALQDLEALQDADATDKLDALEAISEEEENA